MRRRGSPAPWSATAHFIAGGQCIADAHGDAVALVVSNAFRDQNATLLAAAPVLYDALRALVRALESLPDVPAPLMMDGPEMSAARAALKRAERWAS